MSELSQVSCIHRREGEPPLSEEELAALHPLVPAWEIVQEAGARKLRNRYSFDSEQQAREFSERVMAHANAEKHHPVIRDNGNEVVVEWWTHSIDDLHPNDFIMAAKSDGAYATVVVGAEGVMFTDEELPTLAEMPRFRGIFARRYGIQGKEEKDDG